MTRPLLPLVIASSQATRRVCHAPPVRARFAAPLVAAALMAAPLMAAETAASNQPDIQLRLPALLERVGQQVENFWSYFSSVTCTEELTQSKLGEKGKVLFTERESSDYLILLQASGTDLSVDESRVEKSHKTSKGNASLLATNGFSVLTLIFHPLFQSRYEFQRLPDEIGPDHHYFRIGFQQVSDEHPLSVLLLREQEYPLEWRGTAWVDPGSFAVVRIVAGVGTTMAERGLLRLDTDVTYSDVHFNETVHFWLPSRAVIEAETRRQHWRNTHLFSNYRRFDVETQVKTAEPR